MQINLSQVGKRFNYEWIFRSLTYDFLPGRMYALLGHNGSGKSTLLQIISGQSLASEGSIRYTVADKPIPEDKLFPHLSYAAPYLELIEEFTLEELVQFHTRFKKLRNNLTTDQLIDLMYLQKSRQKLVRDFSSGMRQRLKLALALYSDTSLLLLDEPTSNLDQQGVAWYDEHLQATRRNRLVLIGSNVAHEYKNCDEVINLPDYHPVSLR